MLSFRGSTIYCNFHLTMNMLLPLNLTHHTISLAGHVQDTIATCKSGHLINGMPEASSLLGYQIQLQGPPTDILCFSEQLSRELGQRQWVLA